jgi:hypothetical protein
MENIVEIWYDEHLNPYAIVQHSPQDQQEYGCKEFEVLWGDEDGQWASFAGTPGYGIAEFDTLEEARSYLLTGIIHQCQNSNVWFEPLKV